MATRRMFNKTIIDTDEFLDMPISARLLYFDLGMRADDDGFVSPKRIMRITNANNDDLKILLAKKYVINFENKVLVIRDWKVNNFIRPDRYTPTIYQEYLKRLQLTSSNQYQLKVLNSGIPDDIPDDIPDGGIGKVRLGKVSIDKDSIEGEELTPSQKAKEFFNNHELQEKVINSLIEKGINKELVKREINKFISYWTELNKSGTKQRWELEKTFEVNKRLATWFNKIQEFNFRSEKDKKVIII